MEGSHGQLRTGFADGLGGDDADRLTGRHRLTGGQVHAVALGADTAVSLAGQHGADLGTMDIEGFQQCGVVLGHHVILRDQHLVGAGLADIVNGETALDTLGELLDDLTALADLGHQNALLHAAVVLADDDVLTDVHHTAGQITGVGGTQCRIGQALTGATAGGEVFQHGQTLTEVGLDGDLDGLTGGVGH